MAAISLTFVVTQNLDIVLDTFDHIKVYRTANAQADMNLGPYVEITTPTTRIPLQTNQVIYPYIDNNGDPTAYYRCSYYNTDTQQESSQSAPQQGSGDPALAVLSVNELLTNYLIGLDLTTPQGIPFPTSLYEYFIKAAVSWLSVQLDLPLRTVAIVNEQHDYYPQDFDNNGFLQLEQYPILSVQTVNLTLPGGAVVQTFPTDWVQFKPQTGEVWILPTNSTGSLITPTAALLPYIRTRRFIPNALQVSYLAGFETVPQEIVEVVGKVASFGALNIAGDLLGGAGIASQSASIDGLSQSINTTSSPMFSGYGARLNQYTKEIADQIATIRSYYKGVMMRVS